MDILLENTGDLRFENGDFAVGESEMQEVALLLESNQCEWKEHPLIGANLVQFNKSKAKKNLYEKRIKTQLALDGKDFSALKRQLLINNSTL